MKVYYLNSFMKHFSSSDYILPTHISLYVAILHVYHENGYNNSVTIQRKKLMSFSGISSIATYHRRLKELVDFGIILYNPSYNYYKGSKVTLLEI